jgi:hypothetical protein
MAQDDRFDLARLERLEQRLRCGVPASITRRMRTVVSLCSRLDLPERHRSISGAPKVCHGTA